ncbi:hypothetical protein [Cellulophaga baltica]|uniref:Uncharacterized protein n=1 Tax=Cellulophaga baltica TaxID=76594 RepID=A0A1G7IEQ5_9FLAO|nr:hypothetical protein [Cellulophaga baltica]SDF11182.1 hypothetical protein SAMN04487992_107204 [Cellulophaga baltica]
MKRKDSNIENSVQEVFESTTAIKPVTVSPFFKEKVMHTLFHKAENEKVFFSWLTVRVQFALLILILVLNTLAFTKMKKFSYNDNLEQFVEAYDLSGNKETALFN